MQKLINNQKINSEEIKEKLVQFNYSVKLAHAELLKL
jgi:hypothetical protein